MNFYDFRNVFHAQKVFSTGDIAKEWKDFNYVNLVNWQNKGYILKLRNTFILWAIDLAQKGGIILTLSTSFRWVINPITITWKQRCQQVHQSFFVRPYSSYSTGLI